MYRIDTEKLSAFKEATLALRQRIEETKEECTVQTDSISQAWEGDAAEAATQTGQELVTQLTGEAETLCGLEAVLEDALEKSHMLLNQSRKFASILEEGEESRLVYTGYRDINNTSSSEGIIMLDESTVADVVSGCNRTAEYAREIETITYEIDGIMNSLEYAHIDISAQTARIRKGCKRVERIEEYGRSYGRYAEEFIELDRNLNKALAPYRSEEYTGLTETDKRGRNYNVSIPGKRIRPIGGEENGETYNDVVEVPITREFLEEKGWHNIDGKMVDELNEQLEKYEITNSDAIAYILITAAAETSHGQLLYEIPDVNSDYDESESGAGYFQLTHRGMQETFLDEMEESYTEHTRRQIIAEKYAWESAIWYWKEGVSSWDLSEYVEVRGNSVEVFMITQYYINGYPLNQLNPETLTLYGEGEGNPDVIDADLAYMRSEEDYEIVEYPDGRVDARHNTEYLVIRENCYYLPDRWREREAEYYEYYERE